MAEPRTHAARILSALPQQDRDALAASPFAALEDLGHQILMLPEPDVTGDCSVAGSYDPGPPPTIRVVRAFSMGRQHFSALHEYGHALIQQDPDIHDDFFDQPDQGRRLEEDTCDAIAGQLLLPDERVSAFISAKGPTARAVIDLIEASPNSSREACCVRAAERIKGRGHVMVTRDGIAQFTASHGTPYRVRRDTPQGGDHITYLAADRGRARREAPVIYASGRPSELFQADAARAEDGYVITVFVDASPPWASEVVIPRANPWEAAETEANCTHCDVDFTTLGRPCATCNDFVHSGAGGCGRCSCTPRARDAVCSTCYQRRPLAEFTASPEACDICLGG